MLSCANPPRLHTSTPASTPSRPTVLHLPTTTDADAVAFLSRSVISPGGQIGAPRRGVQKREASCSAMQCRTVPYSAMQYHTMSCRVGGCRVGGCRVGGCRVSVQWYSVKGSAMQSFAVAQLSIQTRTATVKATQCESNPIRELRTDKRTSSY